MSDDRTGGLQPIRSVVAPEVEVRPLTIVRTMVGRGVEGDPIRWVVFLHDKDGTLLGQYDPSESAGVLYEVAYNRLSLRDEA